MLDKAKIAAIHAEMQVVLKQLAEKHGLNFSGANIRYNDTTFKLTAEFGDKQVLGDTNPKLFKDLEKHGWRHGFDPAQLNSEFQSGGKTYQLKGMRGKDWVIAKNKADNLFYKFRATVVANAMGVKAPPMSF